MSGRGSRRDPPPPRGEGPETQELPTDGVGAPPPRWIKSRADTILPHKGGETASRERHGKLAPPGEADLLLTDDAFLGGALHLIQPRNGYRAGLDAVLLAAAVPAAPGRSERVLDAGAGVGTAGLCVAQRIGGANVVLVERDARLVQLAIENVRRNDLTSRVRVIEASVTGPVRALAELGLEAGSFGHVLANPPFHAFDEGTHSRHPLRTGARAMKEGDLALWARFLARMAAPGGTVTLIHKAEALPAVLAAFKGRFGAIRVLPVRARAREPAIRVVVQAVKGSRAPLVILAGFVLHGDGQAFTGEADSILRRGSALVP